MLPGPHTRVNRQSCDVVANESALGVESLWVKGDLLDFATFSSTGFYDISMKTHNFIPNQPSVM